MKGYKVLAIYEGRLVSPIMGHVYPAGETVEMRNGWGPICIFTDPYDAAAYLYTPDCARMGARVYECNWRGSEHGAVWMRMPHGVVRTIGEPYIRGTRLVRSVTVRREAPPVTLLEVTIADGNDTVLGLGPRAFPGVARSRQGEGWAVVATTVYGVTEIERWPTRESATINAEELATEIKVAFAPAEVTP